jgi:hypothetical protein
MLRTYSGFVGAVALAFTVACGQTDSGITTSVKSKLAVDDTVKAYQVDVDTRNGVVTLTGEVETMAAKDQAVDIARNTEGVRDVIDQITVGETAATSGIEGDIDAPDADVDVDVDDDLENDARRGAEATGNAVKEAGKATAEAARKAGAAVRDAVTDDDPDSDNDGK